MLKKKITTTKNASWDFPGDPVVKLCASNAGGVDLTPGQGTKIPHAVQCSQKKKKENQQQQPKKPQSHKNIF